MLTLKCTGRITKLPEKKTASKMFNDSQIGDIIQFIVPLRAVGRGAHGSYAVYVSCINERTKIRSEYTFNQLGCYIDMFEIEEEKQ